MEVSLLNIFLAFLEGFALIISPCILPILPIILSSSLAGKRLRPYGTILGFIFTFTVFTFFSRELVRLSGIDLNIVRNISLILLAVIGVVMLSDFLTEKFEWMTQRIAKIGANTKDYTKSEFMNGLVFGALIGLVWTPCAGPILAAVIVQTVLQQSNLAGFLTMLSFGVGAGVPMLLIALFGRAIMAKFLFLKNKGALLRKILGVIILLSVAYIVYGTTPATFVPSKTQNSVQLIGGLANPYPAPAIEGIVDWINSPPLATNQLKGKVVLVDFWAYSCINCIRTLPYLKDWYQKYHDQGFIIIGVHAPEFDFEKSADNLKSAVKKYDILYPVALDNGFNTWRNFHNQYWPAHYLIDKTGNVVYEHFGEGDYDVTENNIRFLLGMNKPIAKKIHEESVSFFTSPETYLGYLRAENYFSPEAISRDASANYTYPSVLTTDAWALRGGWKVVGQKIISTQPNASIKIHFRGKKVFAVMGISSIFPVKVKLLLNGELVVADKATDVTDSSVTVSKHDLYRLIELKDSSNGILELTAAAPGLEVYTFTFG